ncbi:alpha/beta hydrolase domain-containing protein 17C isoform X2 [Balaenoptera acutorostrata]|uniref:Alpha/beta hydrolase domain-containing protein 17C n=1 Tax=Balaenoptera acutorostrata TaxID=9767 RepID=A0ABM3TDW1_BALAC|nr:alpha/beta hydrolase domain-containing protein 17C isoform X2 [Balaenoptera acutorostrata]
MPEPGPRMNGFSLGELCWLFCCPPCPSRIAAKLAFLPPEPTYTVLAPEQRGPGAPAPASAAAAAAAAATAAAQPAPQQPEEGAGSGPGACSLHLSERADWQYSQRELDAVEVFFSRTARDNRLGCMFVRCAPSSRYTLLFSHGNAVDLGQMCSFYIGLGSRINCNIFSYDYSGYGVSSGKPSEKNLYADIDAAWQALRTRFICSVPVFLGFVYFVPPSRLGACSSAWTTVRRKPREHHPVWSEHWDCPHRRPGLQVRVCGRNSPFASDVWIARGFSRYQENVLL